MNNCLVGVSTVSFTNQSSLTYRKNVNDNLSEDLEKLLENGSYSDVTLVSDGKEIRVHKNVLTARSPVFAAMFQHNMLEKRKNKVHIDDIKHEVLKEMLRFIYCSRVKNVESLAEDLLAAAEKYELKGLKLMCEIVMCKALSVDNAVNFLIISDLYKADKLKKESIHFINANTDAVSITPEFKAMAESKPHLVVEIFNALRLD